ncbi:hypothetical protein [Pseudonocardia sp. WMMC193]|uniref:hypothetical protein n=1 Tax=Pseudonocardia sp. WMMC193 TaxID=2911965 RepID=UPI001F3E35A7|nr:hypothetical protein [Pseudonocardia sp. WMMC193]MCF7547206.1 hypothetical protein [Pseudonocardia sp. WMMC193]
MTRTDRTGTSAEVDSNALVVELAKQITRASERAPSTELAVRPAAPLMRKLSPRAAALERQRDQADRARRARRTPYLAAAATAATGYAGWGLAELAHLAAGSGGEGLTVAGIGLLSATTATALRAAFRARIPDNWRGRSWCVVGGTTAWVTAASAIGPANWPMTALLAGGAALGWAGWMRQHEIPTPGAETLPTPQDDEEEQDLGDRLARRWAENVSGKGQLLPGAMLTERLDLPRAIRWTIQTRPGTADFNEVFARRSKIAGGLGVAANNLLLEPSDQNESWCTMTVIVKDLLSGGIAYTGPRYEDGRIPLGPFADGEGEMQYVAYDEVGCRNGLVTGEPGSGKSACLEAVGLGLKHSGVWNVWFGDGDPEGGSSPVLNDISDWTEAGPQGVLRQLEAVEEALEIRSLLKSTLTDGPDGTPVPITDPQTQQPIRKLKPSEAVPGLQWILDELHRLTSDPWLIERQFVPRLERVVRIGRKYGVVVLVGTQSLLAPDYGNSTALRGYLAAINLLAFRNQNRSEAAVVGGLSVAPSTLPTGGGYCFATAGGRLSMGRVAWAPDLGRWANDLPDLPLDRDTDLATARFRPEIPRDPAAVFAEQQRRLQTWRSTLGSAPQQLTPAEPQAPMSRPGLVIPAALTADNVIALHPLSPEPVAVVTADLEALPRRQQLVYAALIDGHRRTGDIAAVIEQKPPNVVKALNALAEVGLVRKVAHGQWQPTDEQTG